MSWPNVCSLTQAPTKHFSSGADFSYSALDAFCERTQIPRMPKRKKPELTPEEQHKRFKEAAKKAGVTKDEEEFGRTFAKVARRPKRQTSVRSKT